MDIIQCKELLKGANIIFQERGGSKNIIKEEKVTSDFAFATVVATEDIKQGQKFSSKNIWVKRPGVGEIKAEDYKNIIGKIANKNIKRDRHLKNSDIR